MPTLPWVERPQATLEQNLDGELGKVSTFAGPGEVTTGELKVVETLEDNEE